MKAIALIIPTFRHTHPLRIAVVLLLLLSLPQLLKAQLSDYTYVFKITAKEAETLYQLPEQDLYSELYLYQVVDSFQNDIPLLPSGHYLLVRAEKESLRIRQHSVHHHSVQQVEDGNHLSVAVRDTNGQVVRNGQLYFAEKEMDWQESVARYRSKRPRKDGWLRVELPGDTLFYQVTHNKIKPQRRRFFRTPMGYLISTPYRWTKNTYHFFKRGFGWGDWYFQHQRFWPFPKKDRQLRGYVALSQPVYRPGDTLRIKTYLTKRNGKPWNKAVQLELYGYRSQKILQKELTPDRPGAFTTEVVLADSLRLDQLYTLNFFVPKKDKYGRKAHRFKLEDYELDAATFSLELSDKEYRSGEPILLTASGKDQNGNPLPGANVEIIALRQAVTDIGTDSLLIPDTLWIHQQDLSLREDSNIRLPDSILPPADVTIKLEAFFSTAGGASTQKAANFQYYYRAGRIDYKLQHGQWDFLYLEKDSSIAQKVQLVTSRSIPPFMDTTIIDLPRQLPLDPFVKAYYLHGEQQKDRLITVSSEPDGIQLFGQHANDSLLLEMINPHSLSISYQFYEGTQLMIEGEINTSALLTFSAKTQKKYQFFYQYTWAGEPQHKEQSFQTYERQLQLQTDLPNKIIPGQTLQVKVSATDSDKRPAKGVEMVAGAINGQFNSMNNLSPPRVTYKRRKDAKRRHHFELSTSNTRFHSPISPHRYEQMGLDSMLYYQIRYPIQGVFEQRDTILNDSFYHSHPQISPYVVEDHKLQPLYLIYLNRELVYSHYSEDDNPYAFNARPGYNQLQLRTRNAVYTIDSVYLAPNQKLSIALDAKMYGVHPVYGSLIKRISATKVLNLSEKKLLNAKLIRIRKEEKKTVSYLYPTSGRIYRWNNVYSGDKARVIGPVSPYTKLTYLQRDGLENTFLYEPAYIYEIREGRERLYHDLFLEDKKTYELPLTLPHPGHDQLALRPGDIIATSPKEKKINFRNSWKPVSGGGDLQILYDLKTDSTLAAVSLQNANGEYSIMRENQRYFSDLPQGYYQLSLITESGYTSSKKLWIYPHQLQVLDLRGASFVQDTSSTVFEDLYTFELIKPGFISYPDFPASTLSGANPYTDVGFLASGVVTDDDGEPLIGASILLLGTTIGTVTDFDGRWSMWVPNAEAIILVSYTGFSSTQVKTSELVGAFSLSESPLLLDEVVVVGYGAPLIEQDNTTQGATLTADRISSLPTRKISALAGRTAGISVSDGDQIRIRGSRDAATDYYVDGVRVSAPVSGAELLLSGSGIRSEFRDYGFWETDLITDDQGEAYFTVTFPDDITQWKTFVLGMDDRKRAGAWYGQTAAFKPVLAQLYLPRFLLHGDQIDLIGSSVNYTNDTFQIRTQFEVDGELLLQKEHQLVDGLTDQITYKAPAGLDSLTAKYTLETGNYQDGEERSIPLLQVGTEETLGSFHRLRGDTTIELRFLPEDGPLTIYAEPDMLRLMLKEMDALIDYPYGCNEQTASRLLALLLHKDIQEALAKPFTKETAIKKMVALLRQRQLPDGSWGWWGGSARNQWMTIYVLRALHAAKEAGYATEAYEKGMLFLTNQLSSLEGRNRLEAIALFSATGQNMDYTSLLVPYDTLPGLNWTTLTTTLVKAQQGLPVQLDTLSKYRKNTLFDGHYWGEEGYGFYHNQIQYTLLAYRIYQASGQVAALAPIQQFFLEQQHRSPGYYRLAAFRNTFEAALILQTIIPDLLKDYKTNTALDLKQTVRLMGEEMVVWDSLPQQLTIAPTTSIQIQKTGVGQTYLTVYQQRWNPQPERVEGPFVLTTSLWQGNQQTQQLEQSRPAQLKVEMKVEKAADYILLEVPIPAGCSYGQKTHRWSRNETYREYFRDKVAIFCEHLEPGEYTYYVALEPRFTGDFHLNPAKAEQMYFPVFFGREGMEKVRIMENE